MKKNHKLHHQPKARSSWGVSITDDYDHALTTQHDKMIIHFYHEDKIHEKAETKPKFGFLVPTADGYLITNRLDNVNIEREQSGKGKQFVMDDNERKLNIIYNGLPEHMKAAAITMLEQFAEKAAFQPPPLPETCPSERAYDNWKFANKSKDGEECLKQGWGKWLKAFNDDLDRDYMSQADLGRLDQRLLERLRNMYDANKLNTIIPSLKNFNAQIAATMTDDDKKSTHYKAHLIARHLS